MSKILEYPTMEQVEKATKEQIDAWYKWLRGPETESEFKIERKICQRRIDIGGLVFRHMAEGEE